MQYLYFFYKKMSVVSFLIHHSEQPILFYSYFFHIPISNPVKYNLLQKTTPPTAPMDRRHKAEYIMQKTIEDVKYRSNEWSNIDLNTFVLQQFLKLTKNCYIV